MTSHLNRVCDHKEMQHFRKCWIPLPATGRSVGRNHKPVCRWSFWNRWNWNGTTCPSQNWKYFPIFFQKTEMTCSSQDKQFVGWAILNLGPKHSRSVRKKGDRRTGADPSRQENARRSPLYTYKCIQGTESLLGQINSLQSRTQFQCCYKICRGALKAVSPTNGAVKALDKLAR